MTGRNDRPSVARGASAAQAADPAPRFDRGVSAVCWAYNEEDLVEGFLRRIVALLREHVEEFEVVFVDDCSTDRTNEIVRRLQGEFPEVRLLRNERNLDVGLSSRRAIAAARKQYLFWQTIDWSYDLEMFGTFLELLKTSDVVAGVRRSPVEVRGGPGRVFGLFRKLFGAPHLTHRSDTVFKACVSLINYLLIRVLFRVPLSDYQNVCFYPTALIQSFRYEARSAFANPEGLIKAYWRGATITEVPISFIPRRAGVAKGTRPRAILDALRDVIRLWFRWIVLGRLERTRRGRVRRLDPDAWPARHRVP